jgi:hypothetical protein
MWIFYPRYLRDMARKLVRVARAARHVYGLARTIKADPGRWAYTDESLASAVERDVGTLPVRDLPEKVRDHAV